VIMPVIAVAAMFMSGDCHQLVPDSKIQLQVAAGFPTPLVPSPLAGEG
jgi:hypothetical protein